jgi:hypothetical protein
MTVDEFTSPDRIQRIPPERRPLTNDDSPAKNAIRRLWTFHEHLERANVTEEFRKGLLLEVTQDEAYGLLRVAGEYGAFNLHFTTGTIGSPETIQHQDVHIPLRNVWERGFPEAGKPWATVLGFTLIWLGG